MRGLDYRAPRSMNDFLVYYDATIPGLGVFLMHGCHGIAYASR